MYEPILVETYSDFFGFAQPEENAPNPKKPLVGQAWGDVPGGMDPQGLLKSTVQFAKEVRRVGPQHLDCASDRMPLYLGAPGPCEYPRDSWPPFILYLWVKRGPVEGMAEAIVDLHLRRSMAGKQFSDQEDGSQVCTRRDQRIPWKGRVFLAGKNDHRLTPNNYMWRGG